MTTLEIISLVIVGFTCGYLACMKLETERIARFAKIASDGWGEALKAQAELLVKYNELRTPHLSPIQRTYDA